MLTTVTINAHPADNCEVRVFIDDGIATVERFTLQDGETATRHVYGAQAVHIQEITK